VETSLLTRIAPSGTVAAVALFAADCSTNADSLGCRLASILHILYIAAAILGFVLLIVGLHAYRTYRQNKADAAAGTKPEKKDS
jgi:hypothetical protein